ncbi:GNAT family N-acetyltransferase [Galbitalea soli]|uniref:GNAT family N-acetyltransferase n=1 Tax=Galbitalea soli TaxID=1268042 RepID=A0A7C9PMT5_9MICO|nr:GNAT family N-acetyltransferase [Galbitalea soli]NEM90968.1 GNAT family N-acetyltransferase [Galbitalea soli]NYJ29655.1 GNAT superfamily N-acetyltransferase [Galbitalea soli]
MSRSDLTIRPANEASWDDLRRIFGTRGDPARCQCQWFQFPGHEWRTVPPEERSARLREQAACGHPESPTTSGIVAYLDGEPVGWCAIAPRTVSVRLRGMRVPWQGRTENKDDAGVWALTCFVVRTGYRRQGISGALARAAVDFARDRGARALEGYPMATEPGVEITWGELFVGSRSVFEEAGFEQVSHPTPRRYVMRVEF